MGGPYLCDENGLALTTERLVLTCCQIYFELVYEDLFYKNNHLYCDTIDPNFKWLTSLTVKQRDSISEVSGAYIDFHPLVRPKDFFKLLASDSLRLQSLTLDIRILRCNFLPTKELFPVVRDVKEFKLDYWPPGSSVLNFVENIIYFGGVLNIEIIEICLRDLGHHVPDTASIPRGG